jgi:hypothetical protein
VVRRAQTAGAVGSHLRASLWWAAGVAMGVGGLWFAARQGYVGRSTTWVENALIEPVEILRNGVPVDTIAPNATERLRGRRGPVAELRWRLLRPGRPPLGEAMEGPLSAPSRQAGRRVSQITAQADGQRFFAPLITNTTASDVTVEVNPGTTAAAPCNCVVPRGAVRAHIGYYRLYANSAVAAYNAAHPYSGPHADRSDFTSGAASASGAVVLTY